MSGSHGIHEPSKVINEPTHGVVPNQAEEFMKNPPNNLGLANASEQDRSNDLVGAQGTEPVSDEPQSKEEKERVAKLASSLDKKGTL